MGKQVFYGQEAREKVLEGAKLLYDGVVTTMSPKGGNVVIGKPYQGLTITHDGVTVAESIEVDDPALRIGADLIKEAAGKLNRKVGDGTTSVTVLTYHLMKEANKLITAGYNPMQIRRELDLLAKKIDDGIKSRTVKVEDRLEDVATISAGSPELGKLIASIIKKVGRDGAVTVEAGKGLELEHEIKDGFSFKRGYFSPFFQTDTTREEAIMEKTAVFVTTKKISSMAELKHFLKSIEGQEYGGITLIADELTGDALNTIALNKMKGNIKFLGVKAPEFGDARKEVLADIAAYTGATLVDESYTMSNNWDNIAGFADKVVCTRDNTTIIAGKADKNAVLLQVKKIDKAIKESSTLHEKQRLETRKANLAAKVAVIKVGGHSETEIDEKKYRIDDAVAATKTALRGGIVAGGGITLINIANKLQPEGEISKMVVEMVQKVLEQPFLNIMHNGGFNAELLLGKVKEADDGMGYSVNDATYIVDMIPFGIIDPANVTREIVRSSFSIAGTAITMGAIVVETPEE